MMIDIGVWELFRTLVALMCFTLVPGYVFLTLAFKKTTFEKCLTIPISLGLGLAISVLVSFITEWAGGSLTDYAYVMLIVDIIGLIAATTKAVVKKTITRDSLKISRTTTILAVIVLVWFGVTLRNGPKTGYAHDTWQHVAHYDRHWSRMP